MIDKMKFTVYTDVLTKRNIGPTITWVEAGTYPVVRLFDEGRILIDVGGDKRQLTIVGLNSGHLL